MSLSPLRTGAALGAVVALFHIAWSALVALGWAQSVIEFVLWLHFLKVPVEMQPFSLAVAAALATVTYAVGFALGFLFAHAWNALHRQSVIRTAAA